MKPPAVLLLVPALGSLCAASQGHLALVNRVPGIGLDAPVFAMDCVTPVAGADGFVAQLYAGRVPEALLPLAPVAQFRSGERAGYLFVADVEVPLALAPDLDSRVGVQLRVWSTRDAATFEEAQARGAPVGQSAVFQVQPAWLLHPPAHLGGLQSFCLVPEPGAGALLAAGAAAGSGTLWPQAGRRSAVLRTGTSVFQTATRRAGGRRSKVYHYPAAGALAQAGRCRRGQPAGGPRSTRP